MRLLFGLWLQTTRRCDLRLLVQLPEVIQFGSLDDPTGDMQTSCDPTILVNTRTTGIQLPRPITGIIHQFE